MSYIFLDVDPRQEASLALLGREPLQEAIKAIPHLLP